MITFSLWDGWYLNLAGCNRCEYPDRILEAKQWCRDHKLINVWICLTITKFYFIQRNSDVNVGKFKLSGDLRINTIELVHTGCQHRVMQVSRKAFKGVSCKGVIYKS
jgi:hypothetical protein